MKREFSINIFADFVPVYTNPKSIFKPCFCCASFVALSEAASSSLLEKEFLLFFSVLSHLDDSLSAAYMKDLNFCPRPVRMLVSHQRNAPAMHTPALLGHFVLQRQG